MTKQKKQTHTPVLVKAVIKGLEIQKDGFYIDGTFGRGGHSKEILKILGKNGALIGIDRDPQAIDELDQIFKDDVRFKLIKENMSEISNIVRERSLTEKVDGVLLDLGVSSPQLDQARRGFSFQKDGPLDMRMDPTKGKSAADWLLKVTERELRSVLFEYGEEKFASRIAKAIIKNRASKPIRTTLDLVDLITEAIPKIHFKKHPATKTFQAIRIFINDELRQLELAISTSLEVLKKGGRLCVISFHSLEDRIVKRFMRNAAKEAEQYRGMPNVPVEFQPKLRVIGKAVRASIEEINVNVRSRSAVLRVAERI